MLEFLKLNNAKRNFFMLLALILSFGTLNAQRSGWVTCDFHQHTTFTDGSYSFFHVMQKNAQYKLDWWANSEHGGGFRMNALYSGNDLIAGFDTAGNVIPQITYWDTYTSGVAIGNGTNKKNPSMWRWQSIRDFSYPALRIARKMYPNNVIYQGLEWNVPGHEHCSVGLFAEQFQENDNCNALAEFEYRFDAGDKDTIGGISQGWEGKNHINNHAKAVEALQWLQTKYKNKCYAIIAHPERKQPGKGGYTIADLRDFNNAAPDVAFGFESVPGHQKGPHRGGYTASSVGGGTYGGSGIYSAKVGGLWDAMLTEGRNYWLYSNSDFHDIDDDFYPGEYQKTYVYVNDRKNPQSLFDGLKSGNVWVVTGDLIDSLYFYVENTTMGGTANVSGNKVNITIKFHEPSTPNHNVYSSYNRPTVDHVDLIAGKLANKIAPTDPLYNVDTVSTTRVIARFDAVGGKTDANGLTSIKWTDKGSGWKEITYTATLTSNMYFRLRGTNLGINVPNETDAVGNPLCDTLLGGVGKNDAVKAFNDLWFFSNPIFVKSSQFTSVQNNSNNSNDIIIYPNPAGKTITIQNANFNTKFSIFRIDGNKVMEGNLNSSNNTINIESLASGVYFIELIDNENKISQKFIKE